MPQEQMGNQRQPANVESDTEPCTSFRGRLRVCYLRLSHRLYSSWAYAFDPLTSAITFGGFPRWRTSAIGHIQGQRILEVGFGTGNLLLEMAERGFVPLGLERSLQMSRLAIRKLARLRAGVPLVIGDARALPFCTDTFDSVIATFPTASLRSEDAFQGYSRVLRRDRPSALILVAPSLSGGPPPLRTLLRWIKATSTEVTLARTSETAARLGFTVEIKYISSRWFRVPVLIARRSPRPRCAPGGL